MNADCLLVKLDPLLRWFRGEWWSYLLASPVSARAVCPASR